LTDGRVVSRLSLIEQRQKDEHMQRLPMTLGIAALAFTVSACTNDSPSPTSPSQTPPPDAIVIDIVADNGSRSFTPNPAAVPPGKTVVWHNVDSETHRVRLDDGRLDTGNISPGAFSAPMTLAADGPYHCTLHPSMVGSTVDQQ
jgi:plastocyanin